MPDANDMDLVREYAARNSEPAFETLVRRHVSLVYSVALRQVGNPAQAEEITQAVFLILARKAARLRPDTVLPGWLHETARFASASFLRGELRRQHREHEAYMQSNLQASTPDPAWEQLAPLLDEAIGQLGKADRNAVVLRFFQNKSAREIAVALNVHESAAQKRLNRAVERLRDWFLKRGVAVSADALTGALSVNSVHGAPAHLAASVMAASAKGTAISSSTLTLIKGALKIMAWTKAKTAIVVGVIVLLAAGTTTVTVKEIQEHRTYPWQVSRADFNVFYESPPTMVIVPTKFVTDGGACSDGSRGAMGIAQPLKNIIQTAYGYDNVHTLVVTDLPTNRYDFMAKLVGPGTAQNRNWTVELRKKIARQFKFTGRVELRDTPVLLLVPGSTGAHGFKVSHSKPNGRAGGSGPTGIIYYDQPVSTLVSPLQQRFQMPVVDRTGLNEHYDFSLTWDDSDWKHPNLDDLKQALREQLGLELAATNLPVEMLVVEKVK